MNRLRNKIILLSLCLVVLISFIAGCSNKIQYDTDWIIGKTSTEITSEYGAFDCTTMPVKEDGLYKNCKCGYTIKEPQQGFFGSSEEILLFITFDENGIAIAYDEGYRPAG